MAGVRLMGKRYLVTGGAGFIGSAVVRALVESGASVRVLDDGSRGNRVRLEPVRDAIEIVQGDVRDEEAVGAALRGMDSVVHLAYVNGTELFYRIPDVVIDVALRGIVNVVQGAIRAGVGELVLASSSEVYQRPPVLPTPEDVPAVVPDVLNPRYSYGGGKIAAELYAINLGRRWFERVLIFRPHNVYGPDMGWEHVIPQLACRAAMAVRRARSDEIEMEIQGDGSQTRAFCHVRDFVVGFMTMLEKGTHLGIYNIGNDEEVRIGDLATKIASCLGKRVRIRASEAPEGGADRRCPDISKLRSLGYEPAVPLDSGLPEVVRWYSENLDKAPRPSP